MAEDRWARLAPLTGLAAVVLLVASALLINNYEYLPARGEIAEFLEDNSGRVVAGAWLGLLASFFVVWFAGSIRTWLRAFEGAPGRLAAVSFGGGVAAASCMLVGYGAMVAAAARAGDAGGTTPDAATPLFDLANTLLGNALPVALAVVVGAATIVAFRTGALPRWLAVTSAVVAVGMLTPVNFVFVALGVLWLGVVSVLLYARSSAPDPV